MPERGTIRTTNMFRRLSAIRLLLAVVLLVTGAARTSVAANVVSELIEQGVTLPSATTISLTPPQMADGLSPAEQQAALAKAAGKHPLDRFVRNSIVAPYSLEITSVDNAAGTGEGSASISVSSLTAHSTIIDQDLFAASGRNAGSRRRGSDGLGPLADRRRVAGSRPVVPKERNGRGELFVSRRADPQPRATARRGARLARQTRQIGSGRHQARRAFCQGRETCRHLEPAQRDKRGKLSVGSPQPYGGLGGYVKITQLDEPAGICSSNATSRSTSPRPGSAARTCCVRNCRWSCRTTCHVSVANSGRVASDRRHLLVQVGWVPLLACPAVQILA